MLTGLLLGLLSGAILKPVENIDYRNYNRRIAIVKCDEDKRRRGLAFTHQDLIMVCDDLEPAIFEAVLYHELGHIYAMHYYRKYIEGEKRKIEGYANAFSYIFTRTSIGHTIHPRILKDTLLELGTTDFTEVLKDSVVLKTMLNKPILVGGRMYY